MPDNQAKNTHDTLEDEKKKLKEAPILPYMWKKGQSGNPVGRPKGKTMKEYARELLECQTDEERQDFLNGLPKEVIWKMAEGNPESKTDLTSNGEGLSPILVKFIDASDNGKNNKDTNGVQKPI